MTEWNELELLVEDAFNDITALLWHVDTEDITNISDLLDRRDDMENAILDVSQIREACDKAAKAAQEKEAELEEMLEGVYERIEQLELQGVNQ